MGFLSWTDLATLTLHYIQLYNISHDGDPDFSFTQPIEKGGKVWIYVDIVYFYLD